MLKINHPAAITRDRQKNVNDWESVRLYKYANGVELQILAGSLPHGEMQSAMSANRPLTISKNGNDVSIDFGADAVTIVDFLNGERPSAESGNTLVLDPCRFLPSVKVAVQKDGEAGTLAADGTNLKATFGDGTEVVVEPHGGHGHVGATRDGKALKCFLNGKDNVLYVFGEEI